MSLVSLQSDFRLGAPPVSSFHWRTFYSSDPRIIRPSRISWLNPMRNQRQANGLQSAEYRTNPGEGPSYGASSISWTSLFRIALLITGFWRFLLRFAFGFVMWVPLIPWIPKLETRLSFAASRLCAYPGRIRWRFDSLRFDREFLTSLSFSSKLVWFGWVYHVKFMSPTLHCAKC